MKMDDTRVVVATAHLPGLDRILARVVQIADELAYRGDGTDANSFLLSGYGLETYRRLAAAEQLYVALQGNLPVAFAVVYPPGVPAEEHGTRHIRDAYGDVPVIKQIATARGWERRGYSRLLYDAFTDRHPSLPVFAAIAKQPRNIGSERFHETLGFVKCETYADHPDGHPHGIWRRPPANQRD